MERLIADEKQKQSIRALEKFQLNTWIHYKRWGIVAVCDLIAIELIQLFTGYPTAISIVVSCIILGLLIWNQIVDKKLLDLTPTVTTGAIVNNKGDRIWDITPQPSPNIRYRFDIVVQLSS